MARLWARTTTFDTVEVGDELPILVKWETEETIASFAALVTEGRAQDGEEGSAGDQVGAALAGQALVSYVTELLEKGFPIPNIMSQGSILSLRTIEPVKPDDTISLSGRVVGKQQDGESGSVECLVKIENQDNVLVAEATARIVL